MRERVSVPHLIRMHSSGEKISALTAYDFTFASLVDAAGVDLILVGDSLGNVIKGEETTLGVTLDEILYHLRSVIRGVRRALIVADMPFLSYHGETGEALRNAGRLIQEGGAQAVKLEGGQEFVPQVKAIVRAGIPVVGHIGLMPQRVHQFGGYRVQGRSPEAAQAIISDAKSIEDAGAFALVLEGIPAELAKEITSQLKIPTIGIGAGVHCSGQILVLHDLLGLSANENTQMPKFVKQFANLSQAVREAVSSYVEQVSRGEFPSQKQSY